MEKTLVIIKPDGVRKNLIGEITSRFEKAGFRVLGMKMERLTKTQAEVFYEVHSKKPFYSGLTDFLSSGPVVLMLLEGEDAIKKARDLIGATDPADAEPATIRKDFADSIDSNIVHGSDAPETAKFETDYFFSTFEILA